MTLLTIWDVYNHLRERRDLEQATVAAMKRALELSVTELDGAAYEAMEEKRVNIMFLTNTLEQIDIANGRVTEADEASVI